MAIFESYQDLIPAYKFLVEIPGFGSVNFTSVDGLGMTHRTTQRFIPGGHMASKELYLGTDYSDVTLKRGMTSSKQLWDWANHPQVAFNALAENNIGNNTSLISYAIDITIKQLSNEGVIIKKWILTDAWVKGYNISSLDATKSEISFESVVLTHSGIVLDDTTVFDSLG